MTNKEFISLLMSRLGNRKSADLRTVVVQELQLKIEELEKRPNLPWFLETETEFTVSTTEDPLPSELKIALPADYLMDLEESSITGEEVATTRKIRFVKKTFDWIRSKNASPYFVVDELDSRRQQDDEFLRNRYREGKRYYALFGNFMYIAPVLETAIKVTMPYCRKSLPILDNDDPVSDWLEHAKNAMMYSVLEVVAFNELQDKEKGVANAAQAIAAWKTFTNYINARKYSNMEISDGDEE